MSVVVAFFRGIAILPRHFPTGARRHDPEALAVRRRRADGGEAGRVRSCPVAGVFVAMGSLLFLLGIGMTVLGYWPRPPIDIDRDPRNNGTVSMTLEEKANGTANELKKGFLARSLHTYTMKILGPLTVGLGVFLFICGVAALYENRGRSRSKVVHLRDIYTAVIDAEAGRDPDALAKEATKLGHNCNAHDIKCFEPQCAAKLAANLLMTLPCALSHPELFGDGSLGTGPGGLPGPWFPDRPSSTLNTVHISGCGKARQAANGTPRNFRMKSIVSSSITAFTVPLIKLNSLLAEEQAVPASERHATDAEDLQNLSEPLLDKSRSEGRGDGGLAPPPTVTAEPPMKPQDEAQSHEEQPTKTDLTGKVPTPALVVSTTDQKTETTTEASTTSSETALMTLAPTITIASTATVPVTSAPMTTTKPEDSVAIISLVKDAKKEQIEEKACLEQPPTNTVQEKLPLKKTEQEKIPPKETVEPEPKSPRKGDDTKKETNEGGGDHHEGYNTMEGIDLLDDEFNPLKAPRRQYTKKEKLLMIARSPDKENLEEDEASAAARQNSSESKF
uniref:transmembrane protein 200A-like n=1 Tax=Myxine glutinosa TaxID=7769 RepID=UPI00358E1DE6